jgi:hypothetical protein
MLTSKAVIQRIDASTSSVRLFQNFNLRSPWSFETRRELIPADSNPAIFPFVFHGRERFQEGIAGPETKVQMAADQRLFFADDYGVPAGFMIAVLFPKGYMPEIFKFKSKPHIPTGVGLAGASVGPPGHFEMFSNSDAKLAAVVFLITQPTYFGFKCIAFNRTTSFPSTERSPFLSDLYASLGFEESHPVQVTVEELRQYQNHFKAGSDLSEIATALNRLVELVRADEYEGAEEARSISRRLQDSLSTTASAIQLSDSYLSGGTIAKVLAYLTL